MAGVPRYADGGDIGLPHSTYLDAARDQFDWDTQRVFASLEQHSANGWQARAQANHLSGDSFLKYAGAYDAARRDRRPSSSVTGAAYRFDNGQNSVDAYASGPFRLDGRQHELLMGAYAMGRFQVSDALTASSRPA